VAPVIWMLLTVAAAGIMVGAFAVPVAGVRGTGGRKGLRALPGRSRLRPPRARRLRRRTRHALDRDQP